MNQAACQATTSANTGLIFVPVGATSKQARGMPQIQARSHHGQFKHVTPAYPSAPHTPNCRPFAAVTVLAPLNHNNITLNPVALSAGSALHADSGTITLDAPIAEGGEGVVHHVQGHPEWVCKLYNDAHLTRDREAKINLMLTRRIDTPTLCWPISAVRDRHGHFRGYLMLKASGTSLNQGLMNAQTFLKKHPQWNRRDSTLLALNIIRGFEKLHSLNVLMGDVNENNIIMRPDGSVSFVDCDSYQIEGMPCPVGTPDFTPPEIQGHNFKSFLRTKEHELFAVAVLLFKIFHPGKHPYAHQSGGDTADNIRKGHFPYCLGDRGSNQVPAGHWRYCWSHLSRPMKDAFNRVFDGDQRKQSSRITLVGWQRLLEDYARSLANTGKTFVGNTRQLGFCLSILPENRCYFEAEHIPQDLRNESRSDYEISMQRLASRSHAAVRAPQNNRRSVGKCVVQPSSTPRSPIAVSRTFVSPVQPFTPSPTPVPVSQTGNTFLDWIASLFS